MKARSIFYRSPFLYIMGLKWIHKSNFNQRYQFMSSLVKKGDKVLEPGCGPGIIADFLPEGSFYRGFDANPDFVRYANKKHPDVSIGNVLDFDLRKRSSLFVSPVKNRAKHRNSLLKAGRD
jgi:SAM-dependent methyltransferase